MKKRYGFTLVELLAILIIIGIVSIIVFPQVNKLVESNKKRAFIESVKSSIRGYDAFLAEQNYPDLGEVDILSGSIPTIDKSIWKSGVIAKYGSRVYIENFYDGNYCAIGYEDSLGVYKGECITSPSYCFNFTPSSGTITGYNVSESCPLSVVIPNTIKGVEVQHIGANAFYNKGLNFLLIPYGVKSIGQFAFASNNLETLVIPDSVTSIVGGAFNNNKLPDEQAFIYGRNSDGTIDNTRLMSYAGIKRNNVKVKETVKDIGDDAFCYTSLTSVELPYGLENIGARAFLSTSLSELNLPSTLKTIKTYAFASNKIKNLNIPEGVETIGTYAFERNTMETVSLPNSLKLLDAHAFFTNELNNVVIPTGLTTLSAHVFNTNKITSITIPSNIKSVQTYALANNLLTSIQIPPGISWAYFAFASNKLTSISFANGVTRIPGAMFYNNPTLGSGGKLNIPEGIVSIGEAAFYNCGLVDIGFPSTLESIHLTAFMTNKISELNLNEGLKSIGSEAFANNNITKYNIPSTVTTLGSKVFNNNLINAGDPSEFIYSKDVNYPANSRIISYAGSSKSIILPSNVQSIGPQAFYSLKLTSVTLNEGLKVIEDSAFSTNLLSSITLPSTLTTIGKNAFISNSITTLVIPNSVSSMGTEAFRANKISSLTIGSGLKTLSGHSFYQNSLKNINIPSTVTSLGSNVFGNNQATGNNAFIYQRTANGAEDKTILASYAGSARSGIIVPSGVKTINPYTFAVMNITSITLPDTLITIGENAFNGSTNLTSITLPDSLTFIESNAFWNTRLTSIQLPYNVSFIGTNAFGSNGSLKTIRIDRSLDEIPGKPWGATSAVIDWQR